MAGSFLGSLLVEIKGDNSSLDKSVKKSEGSIKKFSKFAVGAYALVGVAIIAVGRKFSKLAASAEEIQSKFNVVFGRTAKDVQEWAKTYSDSVGRSISDSLDFLGSIGDLLKPLGFQKEAVDDLSKVVVTLANDLGSFNDMPTADVMRDIQSAMVGNFEVTKKYGVVLNEAVIKQEAFNRGLFSGKGVVDAQVKAQIALDLIIQGTNDAQGDLLRTQESATNVGIRLEAATKDLGIALGVVINEGLTPMKSALADVTKGFADLITEATAANKLMKDLRDGSDVSGASIEALEASLARLNAEQAAGSALGVNKRIKEEIAAVEGLIAAYGTQDLFLIKAAESQLALARADVDSATAKQALLDIEESALLRLEELRFEALSSEEKEIELLQEQIDHWATLRTEGAEVQTLINELVRQRNELLEDQKDIIDEVATAQDFMFDNGMVKAKEQSEAIKQLEIDYKVLAEDGLGSFVSAFQMVGQEGVTAWDVVKQAGKDAISAILKGLGQQLLVESLRQFAFPLGIGIPSGIRFAAASAAAFAGAGLVQNLAEGGVLQPSSGGTPAIMAEAGVAEMAMPLTSSAINPFADAVASRISTTTNNNTQNFNSTFSLNDDNQLREAARLLFPFMRDEDIRRGITV